jgi:WD40 repeat protein
MNEGELELVVWELGEEGGRPIPRPVVTLPGHRAGVYGLSFSPDGARLATSGIDGSVRVFDLDGRERLTMMYDAPVWAVRYSPDGTKLASASHDTTARIWDASSGAELARMDRHTDFVANVGWSVDGLQLVTAGNDHEVHAWRADGSYRTSVGPPQESGVWALAIDREGNVAHAALDGTVHVLPESYVW